MIYAGRFINRPYFLVTTKNICHCEPHKGRGNPQSHQETDSHDQFANWSGNDRVNFKLLQDTATKANPVRKFLTGFYCYMVAAMTALMVCIRFSASSKTMEASLSKTSSVTSIQSIPNLS